MSIKRALPKTRTLFNVLFDSESKSNSHIKDVIIDHQTKKIYCRSNEYLFNGIYHSQLITLNVNVSLDKLKKLH